MTSSADLDLIPNGGGPHEPDPEFDPAWDWWDGMTGASAHERWISGAKFWREARSRAAERGSTDRL